MSGNEPECIWQGNSTPEQYADVYHQLYTFIKARNPTARVAIGGVVEPTPLRLEWLDRVLDHYQTTYGETIPVDVWNIHLHSLQEMNEGVITISLLPGLPGHTLTGDVDWSSSADASPKT